MTDVSYVIREKSRYDLYLWSAWKVCVLDEEYTDPAWYDTNE